MKNKTSIFTGHSGVGKSSLVNLLDSNLNLKTAKVSKQNEQGQHTTTFAEMFDLNFGAKIIDSPGIKGFGLIDIEKREWGDWLSEFLVLKEDCKFNKCIHENEANCAVKQAERSGLNAKYRYKS